MIDTYAMQPLTPVLKLQFYIKPEAKYQHLLALQHFKTYFIPCDQ